MARSIRSSALENRTQRLKLAMRWKPYTVRVAPGVRLAYRRKATAGRWSVVAADGKGSNWLKAFADADDYENANDETILDYWQASARARILARGESDNGVPGDKVPVTVAVALDDYEADLKTRKGDIGNAQRVRAHLSDGLRHKPVAMLTSDELRRLRNALAKKLSLASVNRIANALRAALNLAADMDKRIVSRQAWKVGLKAIKGASKSRNVILADKSIRRLIAEAYAIGDEFGLFVESAATTGARPIQLARLEVQDLQHSRAAPRLMMPSSKKGKGEKEITRRPVPIPENLALRLRRVGTHRPKLAPLLIKPSGQAWQKSDHSRLFRRAAKNAELNPAEVTIYALRHSNIVRQLLANVPIRVVAVNHDTSVGMIEKNYSEYIADHSDSVARPALFNLGEAVAADTNNVVRIGRKP
jgi:hypothetical protein